VAAWLNGLIHHAAGDDVGSNPLAGSTNQFFSKPGPIKFREEEMESGEKRRRKDETLNYT
jgi:hypothetical protein